MELLSVGSYSVHKILMLYNGLGQGVWFLLQKLDLTQAVPP